MSGFSHSCGRWWNVDRLRRRSHRHSDQPTYNQTMRRRWRSAMTGLGLSRVGRLAFTAVANLGVGIAVADAADGQGQPIDKRLIKPEQLRHGGLFGRGFSTTVTIRDRGKADIGSVAQALPPDGDHRLGATCLFTISPEVTPELRLAALAYAISHTERLSSLPAFLVKQFPKIGQAWPGSVPEPRMP